MTQISSKPVSARVLDAAIAWQLSLDSGERSAVEHEEFRKWLASNDEHARAWRQLGMLDQRFSVASGPARAALLQSRESIRQRVRKLGSGLASVVLVCGLALFAGQRPVIYGDGEQSRDFTFVHNVVHANLLAARSARAIGGRSRPTSIWPDSSASI